MSTTTNENHIVIDPVEGIEVRCTPFEPDLPRYAGERLLIIHYNGTDEGFVVLSADQSARLAELLTKDEVAPALLQAADEADGWMSESSSA